MKLNRFFLVLAGLVLLLGVLRLVSVFSVNHSPDQKILLGKSK